MKKVALLSVCIVLSANMSAIDDVSQFKRAEPSREAAPGKRQVLRKAYTQIAEHPKTTIFALWVSYVALHKYQRNVAMRSLRFINRLLLGVLIQPFLEDIAYKITSNKRVKKAVKWVQENSKTVVGIAAAVGASLAAYDVYSGGAVRGGLLESIKSQLWSQGQE